MSIVRNVDFNALPQRVRERLISCFDGTGWPRPIISQIPSFGKAVAARGFLILFFGGMSLIALTAGFGERREGAVWILAHGLGAGLLLASALSLIRTVLLKKSLPFQRGRYVFPMDFIIASNRELKIIPMP